MKFDKLKHSYIVEDYSPTSISDRLYRANDNGIRYFYKSIIDSNGNGIQNFPFTKPDYKKLVLAEVVNSKIASKFGISCPEYKIASTNESHGVVSQDVAQLHSYTDTLYNYLLQKRKYKQQSSLEDLKQKSRDIKLQSIYNELDKTVLFHCATGQKDGHIANILVHNDTGDRNDEITGLTLIDNCLTYPVVYGTSKSLEEMYDDVFNIYLQTGIESAGGSAVNLQNLYYGIRNSKYISSDAIRNHLNIANNILANNEFKQIENEIVEEYCYSSGNEYRTKLSELICGQKTVMEKTTQGIDKYFSERIV